MTSLFLRIISILFLAASVTSCCRGQACRTNVLVIDNKDALRKIISADPKKRLVRLDRVIPGLLVDLHYNTANNFTKTVLYRHGVACLHTEPAAALRAVQAELSKKGLALKIYDAYRPFSVTCRMWTLTPDRRYVADPGNASNHNRAVAVDLTIVDLHTGAELNMGTAVDAFTDSARHSFLRLPPQALANRKLLKDLMGKYGFSTIPNEWWHYQWRDKRSYEVLDLDFDQLAEFLN